MYFRYKNSVLYLFETNKPYSFIFASKVKTNMKIAIFDFDHFQYALTISEIFEEWEKVFIVSQEIYDKMQVYAPALAKGEFIIREEKDLKDSYAEIANTLNTLEVDIISINPIFHFFNDFYALMSSLKGEILFTVHNLNYWFLPVYRGPKGWKEKRIKQRILKRANYIVVEDFLFQYIHEEKPKYAAKHNFVYIPFTLFSGTHIEKPFVNDKKDLKVVLPGSIDVFRRNYDGVLNVIDAFAKEKASICFSFAGPALGDYGEIVLQRLKAANKICPGIAVYFIDKPNPEEFRFEMASADIVLSTSNLYFDGLGTREYIGKTKPTAAIHDMMSYQLPGLLPSHLSIPKNLRSSSISYRDEYELKKHITSFLEAPNLLVELKEVAAKNSKKFSSKEIRKSLPFLNQNKS